jgi:uncharacterized protein YaaN involved in tellurite resistance
MQKKEEEFKYISEEDYKILISVYQQKTFELFNQNIALEAKVSSLGSLVEKLTDNISKITKASEKISTSTTSKRKQKSSEPVPENIEKELLEDEETFN